MAHKPPNRREKRSEHFIITKDESDIDSDDSEQNDSESDASQEHEGSEGEQQERESESDAQEDGSESEGSDSEEEQESEGQDHEYKQMSMAELLKLQEEMGMKAFRQKVLKTGGGIMGSTKSTSKGSKAPVKLKRLNKNRPAEVPMMRQAAPRLKNLQPGHSMKRKITRDPRFDDLSGNLNIKTWQENYGFLREQRKKEKEILKKELKDENDSAKKSKIKSIIQRMENQEREHARKQKEKEVKRLEKQQQRDALRQGRKPKYLSNKERKMMVKVAQFEDLKKGNKLEKYFMRKEKRLLAKERKKGSF